MKRYNPKEIEPKWQVVWEKSGIYDATEDPSKPRRYILEYFPYPSGAAMHVGHVRNYTIGDVMSRHARMSGLNVLHPMGWDAFGLPAENYAIKTGLSPQQAIAENTAKFKQQLKTMGFSYDWSREFASSDPEYYRWTQWFFLLLYKRGLAYRQESLQWWCPVDKTVLANEQVENGHCWRCGSEVEKKSLKQWFFKITDYADRLAKDLDDVDWSESIKSMQRNWIGRSEGAELDFAVDGSDEKLRVFTTRPDTLFGATYMVVAPEHPILEKIVPTEHRQQVANYQQKARNKSDVERQETNREKNGVFTGAYAINPINDEKLPIWTADYVLAGYGTGAIMAVPAHDERDYAFAQKFNLPVISVIAPDEAKYLIIEKSISKKAATKLGEFGSVVVESVSPNWGKFWRVTVPTNKESSFQTFLKVELLKIDGGGWYADSMGTTNWVIFRGRSLQINSASDYEQFVQIGQEIGIPKEQLDVAKPVAWHNDGILMNSGEYNGLTSKEARAKIVADLSRNRAGREKVNYRMRDWLISRQRYWGAPIPMIHCPKDGIVPVPEDQLPVVLPELKNFEPSGDGRSPLANVPEFLNTTCPKCGGPAERETDTMDGFACSSWYFLRFADPHNNEKPFDDDKVKSWLPVDDYIGGAEHAVMHLLYARMWTKVMQDAGLIDFGEPFKKLRNQGMILAPDGQKMSKSKGNTIQPDELIAQGYGADSIRIMELFIGPWNQSANWSVEGMGGSYRFLQRIWTLVQELTEITDRGKTPPENIELQKIMHRTIKKVSDDLRAMNFNTAVAAMMECVNDLYKLKVEVPYTGNYDAWNAALSVLLQLVAPFAPHIAEELWQQLGHDDSIHIDHWPSYDEKYLTQETVTIAVQVNGRLRGTITAPAAADEQMVTQLAQADTKIAGNLADKTVVKVVYVSGRLLNFVVK